MGILKWFKSGTKMKRWMFLILLGIVLVCYEIATIMTSQNLSAFRLIFTIIRLNSRFYANNYRNNI